jgi:peptide/nickel transport system substrate-binding protein
MDNGRRALSRRQLLMTAGAGAAGIYIAGCGSSSKLPAKATPGGEAVATGVPGPTVGKGTHGGRIVIAWENEPDSFDPAIGYSLPAWDAQCCLNMAPLLVFGENASDPVPNAAAAMPEVDAAGTTMTIKLRPGVKFHNGRPVTAADYKWTWERALLPATASWAGSYLYSIEGAEAVANGKAKKLSGVEAVDDMTLRVRLTQRDATFFNILAEPYTAALPREEVERHGKAFAKNIVGAGPFKLTEYDSRGQRALFVRNPDYFWKGLPYLDEVEYRWGIDPNLQLLQLKAGKIDALGGGVGASLVAKVNAQASLKPYVQPVALQAVRWVQLNVNRPPFKDARVRQALNYAIDREQLGRLTFGESEPWGTPFPKNLPDFRRTVEPYGHDPERAKLLLAEAGVDSPSFTFLTKGEDPWPKLAQVIQQQLAGVGVDMKIRTVSSSAFDALFNKGDGDAFSSDWYMVQPTALDIINTNYISDGSSNFCGYANADVDKLAKQASQVLDPGARNDILAQVEQHITQDAPGIYVASLNFILGRDPELENFQYNAIYGTYYDRLWKAA